MPKSEMGVWGKEEERKNKDKKTEKSERAILLNYGIYIY